MLTMKPNGHLTVNDITPILKTLETCWVSVGLETGWRMPSNRWLLWANGIPWPVEEFALVQSTIVCVEDLTANTSWKSCVTFTLKASSPISSLRSICSSFIPTWTVVGECLQISMTSGVGNQTFIKMFPVQLSPSTQWQTHVSRGTQEDADWSLGLCYWHLTGDWLGPTGFTL